MSKVVQDVQRHRAATGGDVKFWRAPYNEIVVGEGEVHSFPPGQQIAPQDRSGTVPPAN